MGAVPDAMEVFTAVCSSWGGRILYVELRAVRGGGGQLLAPHEADASDGGPDTLGVTVGMGSTMGVDRMLQACRAVEEGLLPLRARPHWGKPFSLTPAEVRGLYGARLDKFRAIRDAVDPNRKFSNSYTDRILLDD